MSQNNRTPSENDVLACGSTVGTQNPILWEMYSPTPLPVARARVTPSSDAEPGGLESSLLQLVHDHHQSSLRLRELTGESPKSPFSGPKFLFVFFQNQLGFWDFDEIRQRRRRRRRSGTLRAYRICWWRRWTAVFKTASLTRSASSSKFAPWPRQSPASWSRPTNGSPPRTLLIPPSRFFLFSCNNFDIAHL